MTESERLQKLEAVQMELFVWRRRLEKAEAKIEVLRELKTQLQIPDPNQMKRCTKCRVPQLAGCFYPDTRYADGLYPHCRVCKSNAATERQRRNKAA